MSFRADDFLTLEAYKKAIRQQAARLPSGPRARYWIYRNVVLPDAAGRKQTLALFFVFLDDRGAKPILQGKSPVCSGMCGIESGQIAFTAERGTLPLDQLKKSAAELLGKTLHVASSEKDDLPDYSGLDIEKIKKLVIANWAGQTLVKVVSASRGPASSVRGYVTTEKFILGQDCTEMGKRLGLRSGELKDGAYIMRLTGLPKPGDFELRGYTNTPAGKPYVPGGKSDYPPGSGVPQWNLIAALPAAPVRGQDGKPKLFLPGERYKR